MHVELLVLCASVVLGLVHVVLAAHSASLQRGYRWTAGARDEPLPPLMGIAGRFARALANFNETFPWFVAAVFVVHATNAYGALSMCGAWLYFAGRLTYLPLYAFGVVLVRSLAWNLATAGILLLLAGALLR